MALPTHQVKLFVLFLDGTPIPTARPIFTVLFGKGKLFPGTVGTPNKGQPIFSKTSQMREIWEFPYLPFLRSDAK